MVAEASMNTLKAVREEDLEAGMTDRHFAAAMKIFKWSTLKP